MNKKKFLDLIVRHFNEEELKELCFLLEPEVDYESLPAVGKAGKARELIIKMDREGRIPEFIQLLEELRPDVEWAAILLDEDDDIDEFDWPRPSRYKFHEEKLQLLKNKLRVHSYVFILGEPGVGKRTLVHHFKDQTWFGYQDGIWIIDASNKSIAEAFAIYERTNGFSANAIINSLDQEKKLLIAITNVADINELVKLGIFSSDGEYLHQAHLIITSDHAFSDVSYIIIDKEDVDFTKAIFIEGLAKEAIDNLDNNRFYIAYLKYAEAVRNHPQSIFLAAQFFKSMMKETDLENPQEKNFNVDLLVDDPHNFALLIKLLFRALDTNSQFLLHLFSYFEENIIRVNSLQWLVTVSEKWPDKKISFKSTLVNLMQMGLINHTDHKDYVFVHKDIHLILKNPEHISPRFPIEPIEITGNIIRQFKDQTIDNNQVEIILKAVECFVAFSGKERIEIFNLISPLLHAIVNEESDALSTSKKRKVALVLFENNDLMAFSNEIQNKEILNFLNLIFRFINTDENRNLLINILESRIRNGQDLFEKISLRAHLAALYFAKHLFNQSADTEIDISLVDDELKDIAGLSQKRILERLDFICDTMLDELNQYMKQPSTKYHNWLAAKVHLTVGNIKGYLFELSEDDQELLKMTKVHLDQAEAYADHCDDSFLLTSICIELAYLNWNNRKKSESYLKKALRFLELSRERENDPEAFLRFRGMLQNLQARISELKGNKFKENKEFSSASDAYSQAFHFTEEEIRDVSSHPYLIDSHIKALNNAGYYLIAQYEVMDPKQDDIRKKAFEYWDEAIALARKNGNWNQQDRAEGYKNEYKKHFVP